MKQFKDMRDTTVTNSVYANVAIVFDLEETINTLSALQPVASNQELDFKVFMEMLAEYEHENCKYKNKALHMYLSQPLYLKI